MDLSIIDKVADLKKIVVSESPANATAFTLRITAKSSEMEYEVIEGMERLRSEDHFRTNAERIHGGAGQSNQPETPTPLDGASCCASFVITKRP
jgi:hypothetical protein